MKLHASLLSPEEREKVHRQAVRVLSEVGSRFMSRKALDILKKNGAAVDYDEMIARIPEEMIREALKRAPGSFTLGGRDPAFDFPLPSKKTLYSMDGAATYFQEFETGHRRNALRKDMADSLLVYEYMEYGGINWPPIMADDYPVLEAAGIGHTLETFIHSSKHTQNEIKKPEEAEFFAEAMEAVCGSMEEVKRRKILSLIYCTVPPLVHEEDMVEGCLLMGEYDVPVVVYPMPANASTGPASLYSNIVLACAEGLSGLVLFQMASPGCPIVFGDASGPSDFTTGLFLEGAPEMVLQTAGMAEMAQYYGLPCVSAGCLSDAKSPGPQAAMEKVVTTLPLLLSGTDIINGFGCLEGSQVLMLEQIVVDNEIAGICDRLVRGVEVSDEKDFFDDIARTGPGGHFLKAKNTRAAARGAEFHRPALLDRNPVEKWRELGCPDMYEKANEKVKEILSRPHPNPISDDTRGKLMDILARAEEKLK